MRRSNAKWTMREHYFLLNHLDLLCENLQDTCTRQGVCYATPFHVVYVCVCRVMSVVVMESAMHVIVEDRVHVK